MMQGLLEIIWQVEGYVCQSKNNLMCLSTELRQSRYKIYTTQHDKIGGGGGIDHPPKWADIWGQLLGKCSVTANVGGASATTYKK